MLVAPSQVVALGSSGGCWWRTYRGCHLGLVFGSLLLVPPAHLALERESIGGPSMWGSIHWGSIHAGVHPLGTHPSGTHPLGARPWGVRPLVIRPLGIHGGSIHWVSIWGSNGGSIHRGSINRGSIHLGFTHWDPLWGPSISVPSMADLQGDTFRTSWGVGVLYAPCSDPLVDHFGGPSLA